MRPWPPLVQAAIALVVLAALTSLPSALQKPKPEALPGIVFTSSKTGAFTVKGQVSGLYPGRVTKLPLKLVNRNGFAIKVTSVAVKVGSASAACTYANVSVTKFAGALKVGPNSSRRLSLRITMRRSAPDGCQGAKFPLFYRGTAVKA
jgi:hypothetical protein